MTEPCIRNQEVLAGGKYSLLLYIQLKQRIKSGEYSRGDMIPGEARIVEEYGVSRITVQKALDELENEGIVSRMHGKGALVDITHPKFFAERIAGIVMRA